MSTFIRRGFPKDFLLEVQKGNVEGHTAVFRAGKIEEVGTLVNSINFGISGVTPLKTVAGKFHLSSTSTDDALGEIGAEAILLNGLDANFIQTQEIVVLDGTTVVSTVNDYIGFPSSLIVFHPTGGQYPLFTLREAQGEITVYDDIGEEIEVMKIGIFGGSSFNFGSHAAYIVPLSHTLFISQFTAGVNQGKNAVVEARGQFEGTVVATLIAFDLFENTISLPLNPPSNVPEKSVIELTAFSSAAGVDVFASFEAVLVENKFIGKFFSIL